jgi:GDP-4-dehydro-6-deoxy-D-mannose reductase
MKVMITGITGFAGSHLVEYLLTLEGLELYGIRRWRSRTEHIVHLADTIVMEECDLRDSTSVVRIIEKIKPDRIFHLAAQSFVPTSWHAPGESLTTNIVGTLHIFEAVRQTGIDPIIQVACSSEEYGLVLPEELPIKETNPLRPLSPYAVSKVGTDMLAYQYFKSYGLKTIRTRGFNHTGPRRGDVFVCSTFAKQIAEIEAGRKEPVLLVGNLEARRDFTDVRDMVRAYWLATEHCEPGEAYNICSGAAHKIDEVLKMLLSMTDTKIEVRRDPSRVRPSDVPVLLGDNTKFVKATGWAPSIAFEQTLRGILEYWRERV